MEKQAYSTWLEIDLRAIRNNIKEIKKMTQTQVMAVIKANGYGHGVLEVARAATEAGAAWCGVARIEEALNLRAAGIQSAMMVLGYTPPIMISEAIRNDIHVAIYDEAMAKAYADYAKIVGGRLKAHLKVETGMGRLGMFPEKVPGFLEQYFHHPNIEIDGIFTHLARADEPNSGGVESQLSIFNKVLAQLRKAGICPTCVHAANSAAVMNYPEAYYDMVRPGITILGLDPSPNTPLPPAFIPALTWKARLTSVRMLPPGHGVSYGSVYVTSDEERIGVVPVGYGDGFRREMGQQVLVRGKRVNVIGRVCMDQCMLQLDDVPEAVPGDEVVLLGEQGDEKITVNEIAERWGTLTYEVVCGLADRLPRLYER
ncbi:MAG: alanine racemase [Anaerolineae bacterium]|jgi:alanine racemase|nr:alanine racemase [Anaerolineae bacterium]